MFLNKCIAFGIHFDECRYYINMIDLIKISISFLLLFLFFISIIFFIISLIKKSKRKYRLLFPIGLFLMYFINIFFFRIFKDIIRLSVSSYGEKNCYEVFPGLIPVDYNFNGPEYHGDCNVNIVTFLIFLLILLLLIIGLIIVIRKIKKYKKNSIQE